MNRYLLFTVLLHQTWAVGPSKGFASDRFEQVISPLLKKYCIGCHGAKIQKGQLRLDKLKPDLSSNANLKIWNAIRSRVLAGEMPPKSRSQPTKSERKTFLAGLTQELTTARVIVAPSPPDMGYRVDHALLFDPKRAKRITASPARVWRVSPQIYWQLLLDLDPEIRSDKRRMPKFTARYSQPFSTGSEGFQDYSGTFGLDEPTADLLIRNARELAKTQTTWRVDEQGKPAFRRGELQHRFSAGRAYAKEYMLLMNPKKPPTTEQLKNALRTQFRLILQREPTKKELNDFGALMKQNIADAGQIEGIRTTFAAVVLLREVIFRSEVGKGARDKYGRRMLGARELAYAIAFALTDRRPDPVLLAAAESNKLSSKEAVQKQVQRILNDSSIDKPRILRFFQEYFGYTKALQAFKDRKAQSQFRKRIGGQRFRYLPRVLVHDTDLLIQHILEKDKNVLQELLTTNKTFVNFNPDRPQRPLSSYARRSDVEPTYNLKEWPGANQPISLPAQQRAGILAQPSWLVAFSFNDQTDPIHRGKWVREKLLGEALPDLPLDVDATLPVDSEKTMRERLAITKKRYCWQCHQKMNPLGLTLQAVKEGNGTMLDNTLFVYLSDAGGEHHPRFGQWPILLIGNLGGKLRAGGQVIQYPRYGLKGHRTVANLYTTLLHAIGSQKKTFGHEDPNLRDLDQSGPLAELLT